MCSDLVINVRQVSSYPQLAASNGSENHLVQIGGLGGPYQSIASATLVATALAGAQATALLIGTPAVANPSTQILSPVVSLDDLLFNAYESATPGQFMGWTAGVAGLVNLTQAIGFQWAVATSQPQQPLPPLTQLMTLSMAGALSLPFGTLTVARDPGSPMEVATMGYVGANTVASFNGRNGVVQLSQSDIYQTLCLDSPIASQQWVNGAITAGLQGMLYTCPFVNRWNGRTGSVYLTLSDITCVFFQPGQQPISQTPPVGSDDNSIATTAWVTNYVTSEFAGAGQLATQAWVLANTVNSFNTRTGIVTLTLADITGAGGAPLNSPQLSGTPTAPTQNVGNATAAIATTAFVWQAVQESTTGVINWNGRTGAVTLEAQDIYDAGGALLNGPVFTGVPTAPTASPGTATNQLATTSFVMQEIAQTTAGVASFNTRTGNVTLTLADVTTAGGAPLASPNFTGTPTAPTPVSPIAATTTIPNTNWVVQYVGLSTVTSFNTRTGAVQLNANDVTAAGGLANPSVVLTGQPTAPTAIPGTNTQQLATTQFVQAAIQNLAGIIVSSTPPASPLQGTGWFDMTKAQLFVWTGTTWVIAVNPPSVNTTAFVQKSGDTMAGPLTLAGNASAALQAVPLQQLQTYMPLAGGTFTGAVTLPTGSTIAGYLPLTGGTLTGPLNGATIVLTGGLQAYGLASTAQITAATVIATNGTGNNAFTGTITAAGPSTIGQVQFANNRVTSGQEMIGNGSPWAPGSIGVLQVTNASGSTAAFWTASPASGACLTIRVDATYNTLTTFYFGGTAVGAIATDTVGVTYGSNSDDRLKTNVANLDTTVTGPIIDALQPISFDWTTQPANFLLSYGFSAQATEAVYPQAVTTGVGNPGDENFRAYSMDMSKMMPLAIAEIKALRARVAALEARL